MNLEERVHTFDKAVLTGLVRQALADETATVIEWSYEAIQDGLSGFAVGRIQGTADVENGRKPWSLILKVIRPDGGGSVETDFNYWRREALIYESGLLDDLPAELPTARCYAITEEVADEGVPEGPNEFWIWLEDVVETDPLWSLERYGLAARHLGQMNGAYLVGKALPQAKWLRRPDVDERLALAEAGIPQLPALRHHPLFAELLAGDRVERITHLWAQRERLLTALNELPQTFCHRDAGRRNLIARRSEGGDEQTVAIDWGTSGLGMLGEEIVALFGGTLTLVAIDVDRIAEMDRLIFEGYIAGLHDAGWQGDERLVRFGYTALAALKQGVADPGRKIPSVARRLAALPPAASSSSAEQPRLLNAGGAKQAAAVGNYLLDLGDEALRLIKKI